jgi:hypothetical protein
VLSTRISHCWYEKHLRHGCTRATAILPSTLSQLLAVHGRILQLGPGPSSDDHGHVCGDPCVFCVSADASSICRAIQDTRPAENGETACALGPSCEQYSHRAIQVIGRFVNRGVPHGDAQPCLERVKPLYWDIHLATRACSCQRRLSAPAAAGGFRHYAQ